MGQDESKFLSEQKQLGKQFTVDSRVKEENLTYLTNRQSQQQFLLREFIYTAEPEYLDMMNRLQKRKEINCPFMTKLKRLEYLKEQSLCANYYRIYSLWEYPRKTLTEEITYRALLKQPFQGGEIRSLIMQIAEALSTFQHSNKSHQCLTTKTILICPDNSIKVVDVLAAPSHPNLQIVYQKRSTKNTYLSPQHCKVIVSGQFTQLTPTPFKEDVFIGGMIALESALLERQDDCYQDDWEGVNWDKIHEKLWLVEGRYGSQLRAVIEQMLEQNAERRISWQQVVKKLQHKPLFKINDVKNTQVRQSFIKQALKGPVLKAPVEHAPPPPPPSLVVTETVRRKEPRSSIIFTYGNSQTSSQIPPPVETVSYNQEPIIRTGLPTPIPRPQANPAIYFRNVRPTPMETSMSSKFTPIAISGSKPKPQTQPTALPLSHNGYIKTVNNQFKINSPTIHDSISPLPSEIKNFSLHIADPVYCIDEYAQGKRYEGYKMNGKKEGQGRFYLENKLCFNGLWKDDLMQGPGKLFYQSGALAYDGNFEKDRFHGFGKLFNEVPQQLAQGYNFQNFEDIEQYWIRYEGYFQNDLKEGKGELFLTNGQHFSGNFHIDFIEGEGVYTTKQDKKIRGLWHENKLQRILN